MHKLETRIANRIGKLLVGATLGLALMLGGVKVSADVLSLPAGLHIFLYEPSGPAHDVTTTASVQDGHVYLYDPNAIEVTLDFTDGIVFDTSGNQIGYMINEDSSNL